MSKTNAMRILDKEKVDYEVLSYEAKDGLIDGISVASKIEKDVKEVYKTLVGQGKEQVYVFIIPVDQELDLKKAAEVTNEKKVELIHVRDIQKLTGYIRGGCSPIGMKKNYQTFIHQSIIQQEFIYISAGLRGLQIKMNPKDLISITNGVVCDLI